jgi:hypothetical protein
MLVRGAVAIVKRLREIAMPTETIIAIIAIAAPFVVFAVALAWTDHYSRGARPNAAHRAPAE